MCCTKYISCIRVVYLYETGTLPSSHTLVIMSCIHTTSGLVVAAYQPVMPGNFRKQAEGHTGKAYPDLGIQPGSDTSRWYTDW